MSENKIKQIEEKINEILTWISYNPVVSKEEFKAKTKQLRDIINPIMENGFKNLIMREEES